MATAATSYRARPKPGDRFIHRHFLDNVAFEAGRRDVYATHVVTQSRKWGPGPEDIAIFHTSADQWDSGNHKGAWVFELSRAELIVKEWL